MPSDRLGPEVVAEQLGPVPALLLGPVHGRVGIPQQVGRGLRPVGHGDPHAGGHNRGVGAQLHRLRQGGTHPFGGRQGIGGPDHVVDDHHELVPTQPGHHVAGPDGPLQPSGRLAQQVVAGAVAEGVVHHLEPVQVQEEHPDQPVVSGRPVEGVLEAVQEEGTVGEPRQLVVEGPFLELRGDLDPLGDIAGVHDHSGHRRIAQQVGGDDLHVAPAPLGMGDAGLEGRRHAGSGHHLARHLHEPSQVIRVDQVGHRYAFHGMGLASQDAGHGRAGVEDPAVLADHADKVRGVLHEGGETHLRGLHPLLGGVQVGQVAGHHRDGVHLALHVTVGDQHRRDRNRSTVSHEAELAPPGATGADSG